jgi:hypothetical protein
MTAIQFDREKLRAAVLHICSNCPPNQLGAVNFHKVLYFADMLQYAFKRVPITGATYRKRPYGPTCVQLLPTIGELVRDGAMRVDEVDYFGFRKKEYHALTVPAPAALANEEIAFLDEVIDFVCNNNTARTISEFSHQEPWERVGFGDEIPYSSAYQLIPSAVSQEAFDKAKEGIEAFEAARQRGDALGNKDFAAFRESIR